MSNTTHLLDTERWRLLCGRRLAARRHHKDWPVCKSCRKAARRRATVRIWFGIYDGDGWSLPLPGRTSNSSGAHFTRTTKANVTRHLSEGEGE